MGMFLIYFVCLVTRYPAKEVNPGPRVHFLLPAWFRVMFSNIYGLHGNLDELAVAASHFDTVLCCEKKETRQRHAADLCLPGYCDPILLPRGSRSNGLGIVMYAHSVLPVFRLSMFESDF